jgi:putative ABC transport system permease protein
MAKPVPAWRRYLRFWGPDAAADVDDELEYHLELRIAELVASGLDPAAARAEALRRLGDVALLRQKVIAIDLSQVAQQRRRDWFDVIRGDARIGVRQFSRNPILALVAIATLALGIGASTGIFSIVYSVLLRPLPFAGADRMTQMTETERGQDTGVGPGQFSEWVQRARAFEAIAAYLPTTFNLGDGAPERIAAAFVTPDFFQTRYLPPLHGRYFLAEEAQPGRDAVVVLSHALFMRRFGGDASVIGHTIQVNDQPRTVIGVAPAALALTPNTDLLYTPLALTAEHKQKFAEHWLIVFGQRRPGVSLADAQRDLERVSREIAELQPAAMVDRSARVHDFHDKLVDDYDRQLLVLFGAVGFVLLLSCLNVANLLLARALVRRKEIAIRAALGAGKSHIVRQFAVESALLVVCGAIAAWFISDLTVALLRRIAPAQVPGLDHVQHDYLTLGFLALLTLGCGAFLGVLPALRGLRAIQPALRSGGRASAAVSTRDPLRAALVVAEIALSLVLLTGAGLFIRSAIALHDIDAGFNPRQLLTVRLSLASQKYDRPERIIATFGHLAERASTLPNVKAVTLTSSPPLAGGTVDVDVRVEGRTYAPGQVPVTHYRTVQPGYFQTMGMPMRSGRSLQETDRASAPPVVVINESLARLLWPGESPIGKRLRCCDSDSIPAWREVVGVVADSRHFLTDEPLQELYVPVEQAPEASWLWFANSLALIVRHDGDAQQVVNGVRAAMAGIDPSIPLFDVATYDDLYARATASNRFSMLLFSALAAIALILASVGVYGVLAFLVGQRAQEIGVRVALGARRTNVLALVLRQGMLLTAVGLAIGLGLALLSSHAARGLLYEVEPTDPLTYLVVCTILGTIALAACIVPARRAAAIDPAITLRG